jgi:putative hydrolase of the HAD superfamily
MVARATAAVDDALLAQPPELLPGAADAVRRLARRYRLGIISDTGFASGEAQDRLLARDGLRDCLAVRVYSCDVGHAKPHAEPFRRAAASLGVAPAETLHVGDIERTDVAGALASGYRAVRIDALRDGGPSSAERVVRTWSELERWLEDDRDG